LGIFSASELMSIDVSLPLYVSFGAAIGALLLLLTAWNRPDIKRIAR